MLSVSFVFVVVVVVVFVVVATPKVVNLAETGCLSIGLSFSWHRCYISSYICIYVCMYSLAVALMTFNQKWQHENSICMRKIYKVNSISSSASNFAC